MPITARLFHPSQSPFLSARETQKPNRKKVKVLLFFWRFHSLHFKIIAREEIKLYVASPKAEKDMKLFMDAEKSPVLDESRKLKSLVKKRSYPAF